MTHSTDLLRQESHFAFGKNWSSYANLVTETQIQEAVSGLRRLLGGDLNGRRFLDIGSGSGLHSLAALRLGASEVVGMDLDPDSVATSRRVLQAHAAGMRWEILEGSVFDLSAVSSKPFDVVYSWGVLHHTGDMYRAIRNAASLVGSSGRFAFALYRRTRMCWFWRLEKRWYSTASDRAQARARELYIRTLRLAMGARFKAYVDEYRHLRGMDFRHDVQDWLGGWPYESISPAEVDDVLQKLGMRQVRAFTHDGTPWGFFGSGCDEYVYERL